jgi:hypothetical protein
MQRTSKWLAGLMLAALAQPGAAQASGTLGDAVNDLASDVKAYLVSVGKNKLSIGQFPGKGDMARYSSAGPLLQTALAAKLKELKVEIVDKKGDFELSGEYTELEDTNTGRQFVQIKLELRDRQGNSHLFEGIERIDGKNKVTKYFVKSEADMAKLLGPSVYVPPEASEKERIDAYKKQIDDPEVVIDGTRVRAGKKAPFAVEILTAPPKPGGGAHKPADYLVRQPEPKSSLAFVPIARTEVYAVRLINDADYDAAVDLRIDGLSMFHASDIRDKKTGAPLYRYIIVAKKSTVLIRGWFIDLKNSDEFLVTEYAKSEAGKIGHSANVGTITATFHAAWDKKGSPPRDEPKNPNEYSQSADATGRGDRIDEAYQVVDYQIGVFRGAISVRYAK